MSISKPDPWFDERTIIDLHAAGLLSDAARDASFGGISPARHWWRWANLALLLVGAGLLLAGVVFFFAYNWARMPAIAKFAAIETALWVCAVGAWVRGLDRIAGKVLLLAASVLVGVLLAVYGQVYQTGADAFENYAIWALLILPWVLVGRFGALWILWLTVANLALILFWVQRDWPAEFSLTYGLFLLLAAGNTVGLIGREIGVARGWDWLAESWLRWIIWASVLVYLVIPTVSFVFDLESDNGSLLGVLGLAIALVVGYIYFRLRSPDLLAVAFGVLALCIVGLTAVGRIVFKASDDAPAFLAFGMIVLGVTSVAAFYLRHLGKAIGSESPSKRG